MKKILITFLLTTSLLIISCQTAPSSNLPVMTSPRVISIPSSPDWVSEGALYEVFIRNASPEGTFTGFIPHLDELKALGIETIWIMPLYPIGEIGRLGSYGSPYSIQDYYTVDPQYGTMDDFKQLVEAIHQHGMHVIIDLVINHSAWDNPWVEQHPEWYTHNDEGQIIPPIPEWDDVADLNYRNDELREELTSMMKFWINETDIDGFRADAASMIPLDFWKQVIPELNQIKPLFLLAESDLVSHYPAGFHLTYSWAEYSRIKRVWNGETAGTFAAKFYQGYLERNKGPTINFITNHDENSSDDIPQVIFKSLEGSRAAAVAMYMLPGLPLLYNSQELGSSQQFNLFEKTPIEWVDRNDSYDFYSKLLQLRYSSDVFRFGTFKKVIYEGRDNIIAYQRVWEDQSVLVIVNSRDNDELFIWPEGLEGVYTNLWTGEEISSGDLTLGPFAWYVLEKK